jgi:hypothetical protein
MNKLRDCFDKAEDIGRVINRSRPYVLDRLNFKKQFTDRDKALILTYLGDGYTEDIFN